MLEVLAGLGAAQITQRVFRCVVERVASGLTQDQVNVDPGCLMSSMRVTDFLAGRLQNALKAAQQRERQYDFAKVGVLEITPKVFSIFPDEICQ